MAFNLQLLATKMLKKDYKPISDILLADMSTDSSPVKFISTSLHMRVSKSSPKMLFESPNVLS